MYGIARFFWYTGSAAIKPRRPAPGGLRGSRGRSQGLDRVPIAEARRRLSLHRAVPPERCRADRSFYLFRGAPGGMILCATVKKKRLGGLPWFRGKQKKKPPEEVW